ncbi:MAG: HAMP domain-containing histidine kinase [Actinobacteria bacterium]|nr:HAMP domain-containing histidine kinase [Actinomycetota bacterium]
MRRRLLFSYLSLTLFVLLALELPLGVSFANAERRRLVSDVQTEAFAVALRADEVFAATGDTELSELVEHFHRRTGHGVVVVSEAGTVRAAAGRGEPVLNSTVSDDGALGVALRGRQVTREREFAGEDVLATAVPVLDRDEVVGAVRVSSSLDVVAERTQRNWMLLAALGGVVSLVVLLVSVLLARSFTRPLAALDAGAARLGRGDLRARVPVPDDPPELRGLAESFNATAEQLEALVRSQQSFVADASHELRTPLAALSLRLENLEAEGGAEDLDGALAEAHRLSRLVDGLLTLARAEDAVRAVSEVELRPLIEARLDAWEAVATERGVELEVDVADVQVWSAPGRLEQVLDNLLSNALDVAPTDTTIKIEAGAAAQHVVLEVRDAGPGMTAAQRARAFDRFWRADPSRKERGGSGLGLAIVRRLVTADGGTVTLGSAPEGGLAVTMRLVGSRQPVTASAVP